MKQWYVIQLIAGYEEKVKAEVLRRVCEQGLQDVFGDILIPQVKVISKSDLGEKKEEIESLFPGYMFISFDPTPEAFRLIRTVSRVFRFLGGENPVPLEPHEVDRILGQVRGDVVVAKQETLFEVGREVDISSGPFSGFSGMISEIDEIKQKITVMVSIFGRLTPVEISYDQIKV
jgi:transcriptional antiterminator NusG